MHPLAATQHVQMVDGARQGSQHKERGMVRLDLFGEEFHVAPDGIYGVEGEAEDIADVGGNPAVAISLDEVAILLDLILLLASGRKVARVDAFHADKNGHAAGLARLGDKILNLPGKHINLHHELDGYFFFLAKADEVVEDSFPVFVASEIIVGEKVEGNAVFVIVAANCFGDVLGGAEAHLAALHVDDGAESGGGELAEILLADGGNRFRVEVRLAVKKIVQGLEAAVNCVEQQVAPGFLDFALDDRDARVHQFLDVVGNVGQEREVSADVEAADQDRESGAAEGMGQIASAGELVRLHTDQTDDGFCAIPELGATDALDRNFVDRFVEEMHSDIPGVAEALLLN